MLESSLESEKAVVSGKKTEVFRDYKSKRELNHPRKGPFSHACLTRFSSERFEACYLPNLVQAVLLRNLRVEIGTPTNLKGDLPDGHEWGDTSKFDRGLPNSFVRLEKSQNRLAQISLGSEVRHDGTS